MPRHVRKGDTVYINAGAHKGRTGEVLRVLTSRDLVVVQGINLRTRHMKPTRINPQGGVITKEAPIHISNVSPAVDGKPCRVRFRTRPDGSKVRIAVRAGAEVKELGAVSPARPSRAAKAEAKAAARKPAATGGATRGATKSRTAAAKTRKAES